MAATLAISSAVDADTPAIVDLWLRCGLTRPWNDPAADLTQARRGPNSDVLVGRDADGKLTATVMVGHDGHRGWVYYVAVDPAQQKSGFGRAMMAAAECWLSRHGILKMQLMVRADNAKVQKFYEALGYAAQERVVFARWLDGREPTP